MRSVSFPEPAGLGGHVGAGEGVLCDTFGLGKAISDPPELSAPAIYRHKKLADWAGLWPWVLAKDD